MKKKIISIIVIMLVLTLLPAQIVKADYNRKPKQKYYEDIMGTDMLVGIYNEDKVLRDQIFLQIADMFTKYNILTDNFYKYDENGNKHNSEQYDDSKVVNNVYYINENVNTKIEIDKELYTILELSEVYKMETYGYFDISIGKIIDKWKELIDTPIYGANDQTLTDEEFDAFVAEVMLIEVIEDGILLEADADKYYVTIKDGVKIDLGAIAKGYVVEVATDIIKSYGIVHYEVGGSDSSLHFGEFPDPDREDSVFKVGILSPDEGVDFAAIIKVKNTSVGISGDVVQYYIHKGIKYHHIVSPKTKMPEDFRSIVALIGPNAAKVDALTTALMNMPDNDFYQWIIDNPEYATLSFTETKTGTIPNGGCNGDNAASNTNIIPIILVSVIVLSIGALVVANYYSNKKKEQDNENES